MKKNLKRSLLLFLVFVIFSALTLTASAKIDEASTFAISCLFGHNAVATPTIEATCTENGSYGGSSCSRCGIIIEEAIVVPAKGHTKSEIPTLNPATVDVNGAYVYDCINCNMAMESVDIPKIDSKSVKLSATKYTYNAKVRKPTITVKDSNGKALVYGQDYDVVYPDGMKMPGKYEVTIIFKGIYTGEKKLSFTIAPKATTGVKVKVATTDAITLEWTKTTGATGYRVYQYSPSKGKYVVKASVKDVTTYKVTDLKANSTYKFKIKPYVKSEDGTVIWGDASSACSAKTTYGVSFTGSSAPIYVGETKQIKATTAPANKALTWKSSDKSVAKVSSSGKVTALKNGTATITASFKYNGKTYKDTYKLTVKKPSIKLSETSATILEGKTLKLRATTTPADLEVVWKSSDTSVATVSSGLVTAKKEGIATISAIVTYKGITYKKTCKITVNHIPTTADNVSALVNYIVENGTRNENGLYVIDYVDSDYDDPNYICTYGMSYYDKENRITFNRILKPIGSGIEADNAAHLYIDSDSVYFGTLFTYYNSYGKATYQAFAEDTFRTFEYIDEYSIYDSWTFNSFPSDTDLSEVVFLGTKIAMMQWDIMVYDAIGVGLKSIGFSNYRR